MEYKYTRALLPGMFLDYDCVIIPELGGFVCNERTAWYDEDKEEMVPPSRDVLFNPNLVYNRWGEEVYYSEDAEEVWTGAYQNETHFCADGIYLYSLRYEDQDGPHLIHGHLALLR